MKRTLATILGLAALIACAGVRAVDIPQIDGETRSKLSRSFVGKTGGTATDITIAGSTFSGLTNKFTGASPAGNLVITTNAFGGWRIGTTNLFMDFYNSDGANYISIGNVASPVEFVVAPTEVYMNKPFRLNNSFGATPGSPPNFVSYTVNSGSTVARTRTATLSGAAWPALTTIGEASTNLINISGCVTNTSHILLSVFPVETGCIYRAGVLTNGTAIVIREAIVACPVVTNLVRVTDFGF